MINKQKKNYMKKIYIAPEIGIMEYRIDNIMLSVSITYDSEDEEIEFDANAHRSDWDNIWANM